MVTFGSCYKLVAPVDENFLESALTVDREAAGSVKAFPSMNCLPQLTFGRRVKKNPPKNRPW